VMNSGTLTCLWWLSIMPTTECGRFKMAAKSALRELLLLPRAGQHIGGRPGGETAKGLHSACAPNY
jgi:hypothetical protein